MLVSHSCGAVVLRKGRPEAAKRGESEERALEFQDAGDQLRQSKHGRRVEYLSRQLIS